MSHAPLMQSPRLAGCSCCGPMRRCPELRRLARRRERQAVAREIRAELSR